MLIRFPGYANSWGIFTLLCGKNDRLRKPLQIIHHTLEKQAFVSFMFQAEDGKIELTGPDWFGQICLRGSTPFILTPSSSECKLQLKPDVSRYYELE